MAAKMPEEVRLHMVFTFRLLLLKFLFPFSLFISFSFFNIHSWSYLESSLYFKLMALAFIREQF